MPVSQPPSVAPWARLLCCPRCVAGLVSVLCPGRVLCLAQQRQSPRQGHRGPRPTTRPRPPSPGREERTPYLRPRRRLPPSPMPAPLPCACSVLCDSHIHTPLGGVAGGTPLFLCASNATCPCTLSLHTPQVCQCVCVCVCCRPHPQGPSPVVSVHSSCPPLPADVGAALSRQPRLHLQVL